MPRSTGDFLEEEYDSPYKAGRVPTRSYVLCSTPRTGSGLLARALAAMGPLGRPTEYLSPFHRGVLTSRWGCGRELDRYVAAVHARRTTEAGLFGAKVHWWQLVAARAEAGAGSADEAIHETPAGLLERLFPSATYVRLIRLDLDRQAVSWWRAMDSGVWSQRLGDGPAAPTPYNFAGIDRTRRLIEIGELGWERLLRTQGIDPLVVTYEELSADYEGTVARVARRVAPDVEPVVEPPRTGRMGDERSEELLERYRRDRLRRGGPKPLRHPSALHLRARHAGLRLRRARL